MRSAVLELPADHPGFADPEYRRRRSVIAAIGASYQAGEPIPDALYTAEENNVWQVGSA